MTESLVQKWEIHSNLILYAFDYCLKRNTYAPSEFVKNVKKNKELISQYMVEYMLKEINRYIQTDYFKKSFSDIKETWLDFKNYLENINKLSTINDTVKFRNQSESFIFY